MAKNNGTEESYSAKIHAQKVFRTIICVFLCFQVDSLLQT